MQSAHRTITTINLVFSGIFIVLAFKVPETIIRFFLLGELPGGTTLLSPDAMLAIIALTFLATVIFVSPIAFLKSFSRLTNGPARLPLPKRRFTSLIHHS